MGKINVGLFYFNTENILEILSATFKNAHSYDKGINTKAYKI